MYNPLYIQAQQIAIVLVTAQLVFITHLSFFCVEKRNWGIFHLEGWWLTENLCNYPSRRVFQTFHPKKVGCWWCNVLKTQRATY